MLNNTAFDFSLIESEARRRTAEGDSVAGTYLTLCLDEIERLTAEVIGLREWRFRRDNIPTDGNGNALPEGHGLGKCDCHTPAGSTA